MNNGDFDAGMLRDTTAAKWESPGLRVPHASPNLPPYTITAGKRVTEQQFNRLRAAFLNLGAKNPEHETVVRAPHKGYDGFIPAATPRTTWSEN